LSELSLFVLGLDFIRDFFILFIIPTLLLWFYLFYKNVSAVKPGLGFRSFLSFETKVTLSQFLYSNIRYLPLLTYLFFRLLSSPSLVGFLLYDLDVLFPSVAAAEKETQVNIPLLEPSPETESAKPVSQSWYNYFQDLATWVYNYWFHPSPTQPSVASVPESGSSSSRQGCLKSDALRKRRLRRGLTRPVTPSLLARELSSLSGNKDKLTIISGPVHNLTLIHDQHNTTTSTNKTSILSRISCSKCKLPDCCC